MNTFSVFAKRNVGDIVCVLSASLLVILSSLAIGAAESVPAGSVPGKSTSTPAGRPETFATPEQAAASMVDAAEKFDVTSLLRIVGLEGEDVVLTGELAQDRERAQEFAAQARKQMHVVVDPKTKNRAFVIVGEEDWPFALPIVKHGDRWSFDVSAGRQELFNRRIGSNELDAIDICHGFVEAQHEYAFRKRQSYEPAQYAQRIVASPGQQDGLAWQDAHGAWTGPVGEKIARAIEQGYSVNGEPYHGYFFKVLKGQGPAAPLGKMDFVVNGVMIGGFALVAAPAEYGETGLKTFTVSYTGVVYEKDFGPETLDVFQKMERFDPDKSWTALPQQ